MIFIRDSGCTLCVLNGSMANSVAVDTVTVEPVMVAVATFTMIPFTSTAY